MLHTHLYDVCERQKSTQNRTYNVKLLSTYLKYLYSHTDIQTTILPAKQNSIYTKFNHHIFRNIRTQIIYTYRYIKSNRVTTSDLGSRINILCQFYVHFLFFSFHFYFLPFLFIYHTIFNSIEAYLL